MSEGVGMKATKNPTLRMSGRATLEGSAMTETIAAQRSNQAVDDNAIRPFRVNVPEGELTELRRRIKATR